jgi:hypothetical protein
MQSPLDQKPIHYQVILIVTPDGTTPHNPSLFPQEVTSGFSAV